MSQNLLSAAVVIGALRINTMYVVDVVICNEFGRFFTKNQIRYISRELSAGRRLSSAAVVISALRVNTIYVVSYISSLAGKVLFFHI